MEFERITDVKNSVGTGIGLGANVSYALKTNSNSVYRVTGMDQIDDIIYCGYVRPKGYGARRDKVGDKIYWSIGSDKLYYINKQPVLEASIDKVYNGKIGAIPLDDLTSIWIFDESENKYINRIDKIKELHSMQVYDEDSKNITK